MGSTPKAVGISEILCTTSLFPSVVFFLGFCSLQTIACICRSIDQGTVKGDGEHLGRDGAGIDECGQGQCKYCVQLAFLWTEQFPETIFKS